MTVDFLAEHISAIATTIITRLKELDAQNKTVIVLLADQRRHFDEETAKLRNQMNELQRQHQKLGKLLLGSEKEDTRPNEDFKFNKGQSK